jgi:hypothetical protein
VILILRASIAWMKFLDAALISDLKSSVATGYRNALPGRRSAHCHLTSSSDILIQPQNPSDTALDPRS